MIKNKSYSLRRQAVFSDCDPPMHLEGYLGEIPGALEETFYKILYHTK
jgi:hypothetical protein